MMRPTIKARMKVVGLVVVLACSELMASKQSSLERARELVSIGSFDKAEAMLRQTIAADPSNIDARVLLGTTLALQGVRGEAIEQLAEAVRLNPSSATAHNEFGVVLSRFVEVKAWRRPMSTCHWFSHRLASWPQPVTISIAPLNYKVTTQRRPTRIT
jgi:Tfp pilus assembly protein PilF